MGVFSVLVAMTYGLLIAAALIKDKANKRPLLPPAVFVGIIALHGVISRFSLYVINYAPTYDEATLYLATYAWNVSQFFEPLPFEQTAAPGFLALSKAVAAIWGSHEYSLRLIPLIAGLCVLALIYNSASNLWSRPAGAVAVFLAGHHFTLMAFSAIYKQYEIDALCTAAAMAVAARYRSMEKGEGGFVPLLLFGLIAVTVSQTAIISLLAVMGFIAVSELQSGGLSRTPRWSWPWRLSPLALVAAVWVIWLALMYFSSYAPVSASPYMRRYWADNFLSLNRLTAWRHAAYCLLEPLPGSSWLLLVFCGLGIYACVRKKDWAVFVLLALPVLLTAGLSVFERYPVAERLWLFLAPVVVISASIGLTFAWQICLSSRVPRTAASVTAGIGVSFLLLFQSQDHLGILDHSMRRLREAITGPTQGAAGRHLVSTITAAPRCESVYIASRSIPSWFYYTSQVQRGPETERRFAFIQRLFHRDSAAWGDAESWQVKFPNPATWLRLDSGCGREVYGLASGTPNRARPLLDRRAIPGWAENELNRVAATGPERYWLYLDHTGEFEWKAIRREAQERGYTVNCHTLGPEFVVCEVS